MTATTQVRVEAIGDGRWHVTGGTEPHLVEVGPQSGLRCDCQGFKYRGRCRHVEAVNGFEVSESASTGRACAADPPPGIGAGPGLERDVPPPDAP